MEYVAPGVEPSTLDPEKELKVAQVRMKEQKLKEMKELLAKKEKSEKLTAKLAAADPKELRVDHENDQLAYKHDEFVKFYTGTAGVEKWFKCPTVGEWATWGEERPKNVTEDQWIDLALVKAKSLVEKFETMKEEREKERRIELQSDSLVQEEIAKAKEEAKREAEAEKANLLAELARLRAATAGTST